ncbi:hypothetical protein F5Y13DRAFT_198889 [Hypoxylon sp. FL1857]|nr:hypothetical protein F5Y13DRAFT_198889 [Hypoxylon sp. FL1857]
MCYQVYHAYVLCPCQIRQDEVRMCSCKEQDENRLRFNPCPFPRNDVTGEHCHGWSKLIVQSGESYCVYHAERDRNATRERRQYFIDRGNRLRPAPENTPVLGRRIGGMPLRTATAADLELFAMPVEHYFLDDSSDEDAPEDEKMWNFASIHDEQEWYGCRSHYHRTWWHGHPYWQLGPRLRPGRVLVTLSWKSWLVVRLYTAMEEWRASAIISAQPDESSVWSLEFASDPWQMSDLPSRWSSSSSSSPPKPGCKKSSSSSSGSDSDSDAPKQAFAINEDKTNEDRVAVCKKRMQFRKRSTRPMVWFKKRVHKGTQDKIKKMFDKFLEENKWMKKLITDSLPDVADLLALDEEHEEKREEKHDEMPGEKRRVCVPVSQMQRTRVVKVPAPKSIPTVPTSFLKGFMLS